MHQQTPAEEFNERDVVWRSLDRRGQPVDLDNPNLHCPRHDKSPPLKNGSLATPSDYDHADVMIEGHLHVVDYAIIGIHAEMELAAARFILHFCLRYEAEIVARLSGRHHNPKVILLRDVWGLMDGSLD